jgi:4-amino-4-deoxy-L-arabinose transferase-like glycosyltransferase
MLPKNLTRGDIITHEYQTYLFLSLILLGAFFLRFSTLINHSLPAGDEGAFLSIAVNIHEGNGFKNNVLCHYYNRNESLPYPEDNRHPLYPMLIAGLLPLIDNPFLAAQWISFIGNLLCIGLIFSIGRKVHSPLAGLLAACMMAVSWPQIKYAVNVYAESLFELIVLCIIYVLCLIKEDRERRWLYLCIGALIGAAYLCRQNGIFLFVAVIGYAFFTDKRAIAWLSAGFFSVALWWMIRNYIVFGNPFYNHFNYFLWIDHYKELWYTIAAQPPSLNAYIQTHSLFDVIRRCIKGFWCFCLELWSFEGISFPYNKVLVPFFLFFLWSYKKFRKPFWDITGIYFILTFMAVIWICRYLLFYYPLYFLAAAIGMVEMHKVVFTKWNFRWTWLLVILVVLFSHYYPLKFLISARNGDAGMVTDRTKQISWIQNNLDTTAVILTGDLAESQYAIRRNMIRYPMLEDIESVLVFGKKVKISHLIISPELVMDVPLLQKYWSVQDGKVIENTSQIPAYLGRIFCSEGFIVYRVLKL